MKTIRLMKNAEAKTKPPNSPSVQSNEPKSSLVSRLWRRSKRRIPADVGGRHPLSGKMITQF